MKALQLQRLGALDMIEMPRPAVADDQLLIRTGAATLCTSDLNDIRENPFQITLPVIMGHEAAGTVAEVGRAVRGFQVGDRVTTHPVHPCGRCVHCRMGLAHLCSDMGHFGLNLQGTYAEYYPVRQDRARPIPDTLDFATASLAEPVCVCLEALAQARLKPGQTLLIIGDGPFGILTARLAVSMALGRIVILGHHAHRLGLAGPTAVALDAHTVDNPYAAAACHAPGGFDAVILAVGARAAVNAGLHVLKARGRLVMFSAIPHDTPVDLFQVHLKELEIVGACNDLDMLNRAVILLSDSALGLNALITHRFPFARYREAFALAENGKAQAVKVTLEF